VVPESVHVQSFPKKDLQGVCLSTHIPPDSQNGREAQHARAMDRNLVNLFSEMTVLIIPVNHTQRAQCCHLLGTKHAEHV